jgi:4-hydroxy-3-methylbut-2-enyl diphosphate reductase
VLRTIHLINPRGFCAGVNRSIAIVERCLEIYGKPIHVRHQIVHNEHVIRDLERKGAVFVEELSEVPPGSRVILSAHGSPPEVQGEAERRGIHLIDAVCPLVIKVHHEAVRFHRKGYDIVLIGHRGHQEVKGTMGHAPMTLIETVEDVASLDFRNDRIAYLTQTTLSVDDTRAIVAALRERYPGIEGPTREDICYATTNRQEAVKALAGRIDLLLVIGSVTSSNSNRLVETAIHSGVQAHLVPDASGVRTEWFEGVDSLGVTSGASVPDNLVFELVDALKERFPGVEVVRFDHLEEDVEFSMPESLRAG